MVYVNPPVKLSESHPVAHELLVEECQRRGRLIDEAVAAGKPIPDFKPIVFRAAKVPVKAETKVGRNDPCPCGSSKKFKRCCGQ